MYFVFDMLSNCLMHRSVRRSVSPEAVECRIDFFGIEPMGISVPLIFQISHDGTGLFSHEDIELGPRMIVPGHVPVSTRIDERRFADGLL
jgi:hypothetical protein